MPKNSTNLNFNESKHLSNQFYQLMKPLIILCNLVPSVGCGEPLYLDNSTLPTENIFLLKNRLYMSSDYLYTLSPMFVSVSVLPLRAKPSQLQVLKFGDCRAMKF